MPLLFVGVSVRIIFIREGKMRSFIKQNISKKSLLACAVSLALIGCGGSDNDNNTNSQIDNGNGGSVDNDAKVGTKTITAIDGYLINAVICNDTNNNLVCEDEEVLKTQNSKGETVDLVTNANGQVVVTENVNVLVKAVAGQTVDADTNEVITQGYTLASHSDSDIVSPFSTLASLNSMSMEALADHIDVDADVIKSDFVAAKAVQKTSEDAKEAHLVARSVVRLLPEDLSQLLGNASHNEALLSDTVTISNIADDVALDNIDNLIIEKDESGFVVSDTTKNDNDEVTPEPEPAPATLQTTLEQGNGQWYSGSFNSELLNDETVELFTFTNGTVSAGASTFSYTIEGNTIIAEGEKTHIIYSSDSLILGLDPKAQDMVFFAKHYDLSQENAAAFSAEALSNQTLYAVMDDNASGYQSPEPMLIKQTFKSDGKVVFESMLNNESFEGTWSVNDAGVLTVVSVDEGNTKTEHYYRSKSTADVYLVRAELNHTLPMAVTTNYETAKAIFDKFVF